MKVVVASLIGALSLAFVLSTDVIGGAKAKYSIKEVMKKAHNSKLFVKVADGKASEAEKTELIELYTALAANTPPKGDAAGWKEKTTALLNAAKSGDGAAIKKAATCGACHSIYK